MIKVVRYLTRGGIPSSDVFGCAYHVNQGEPVKYYNKSAGRVTGLISALAIAASVVFGGALMAEAKTADSSVTYATSLELRSAAIPQQPAADPSTGRLIDGPAFTTFNEPVWTRTCNRGYGDEIWNAIDPKNCAGTMSYYYYNVRKATFNMVKFLASQPSNRKGNPTALLKALDKWCDDHSFQCQLLIGVALLPATTLFGSANS